EVCKGPRTALHRTTDGGELHFCENVIRPYVCCQWGSGIEVSNYDDAGRVLIDNAMSATKYINVDARVSNMAKEADYYLNVRPGTDAALALAWLRQIADKELYDDLYLRRWTNATFLVCPTAPRTNWVREIERFELGIGENQFVSTILLTQDQVVEGGSPFRFMAWDEINERLTYLDSETGLWEGETFNPKYVPGSEDYIKRAGIWDAYPWEEAKGDYMSKEQLRTGMSPLFVPEPSQFNGIYPALSGSYEVMLLDGSVHTATPVWDYFYEHTLKDWTFAKAQEVSGVDASLIEEACMTYATRVNPASGYGNGCVIYAVTHEHTGEAITILHALQAIDVVLGNTDIPGGHRGPSRVPNITPDQHFTFKGPSFDGGGGAPPSPEALGRFASIGAMIFPMLGAADASYAFDTMLSDDPFPLRGGITMAGGILNQSNITTAWNAYSTLEYAVNINLWHDPISDVADVLLPAAHWLEVACPRTTQGAGGYYGALIKCIDSPGECMWDIDFSINLYKASGQPFWPPPLFPDAPNPWADSSYTREYVLSTTGMSWAEFSREFQEKGWFDNRVTNRNGFGTAKRYETGWFRLPFDGKPGFVTPTTRNELWITNLEAQMGDMDGLRWALPAFTEPKYSPVRTPDVYAEYPYILSTGRRIPVYFHSEHRQLPWCREVWPVPRVEVNPADASELGVAQGDWLWLESPFGKIRQCVDISAAVAPGRMNAEHTWWFPELYDTPGKGFDLCGCNCLVDAHAQCAACGAPQLRGYLIKAYKATPENSPFGNPIPCGVDGTEIIHDASDPRLKEWAIPWSEEANQR
ncbi:MAG: hypothetical protein IJJ14_08435, partial [Coriobacteriales bacterium]|nr:hypothetical protein [Coriobacteriales bacterium]